MKYCRCRPGINAAAIVTASAFVVGDRGDDNINLRRVQNLFRNQESAVVKFFGGCRKAVSIIEKDQFSAVAVLFDRLCRAANRINGSCAHITAEIINIMPQLPVDEKIGFIQFVP